MTRLLKIRKRQLSGYNGNGRPKDTKFDSNSGLAYAETVQSAGPMRADWIWQSRGLEDEAQMYRKAVGTSSLRETAIRCACTNVASLTAESLETVPSQIGIDLWIRISRKYKYDSFHAWKVFAMAYSGEGQQMEPSLKFREQIIFHPNMALPDYMKPVTAPSFEWITYLTLNNVTCSRLELVNISKLTNLGALTICGGVNTPDGGLDDSLLRTWARAASELSAFSMLRVLACRRQMEISDVLFQHISLFPVLSIFVVEACKIGPREKPVAKSLGWRYQTGQELRRFLDEDHCKDASWCEIIKTLFIRGGRFCMDSLTAEGVQAINALPMLSFSIGGRPTDAAVDGTGGQSMRCFYRTCVQESNTKKRRLPLEQHGKQPPKRRDMKVAKPNFANNAFTEFGF